MLLIDMIYLKPEDFRLFFDLHRRTTDKILSAKPSYDGERNPLAKYSYLKDGYRKGDVSALTCMVAAVMTVETGIRFGVCRSDRGALLSYRYVTLERLSPWELSEKERTLTEKSLKEIMDPYATPLGVETTKSFEIC